MRPLSSLLIAACLLPSGSDASNSSSVKELGIEVHFTQCTDSVAEGFHLCGKELWKFRLNATGWRAEHENLVAGIAGQWTATCKDEVYAAHINGKIWSGRCGVTGDQERLCLNTQSAGVVPGEPGGQSEQCFDLSGATCRMDFQGKIWQLDDSEVPSLYLVTSRDVTACRISSE